MTPTFQLRPETSDGVVIREILTDDCYRFLKRAVSGLVIDIGANIGVFTVLASLKGAEVEAYEPESNNFTQLLVNCELNGVKPEVFQLGIGSGETGYFTNNFGGTRREDSGESWGEVAIISLDDVVGGRDVELLKIDCEGSEYDIFSTCSDNTLRLIQNFVGEFHPDLTSPEKHSEVIDRLGQFFDLEITGNIPAGGGIVYGTRKS